MKKFIPVLLAVMLAGTVHAQSSVTSDATTNPSNTDSARTERENAREQEKGNSQKEPNTKDRPTKEGNITEKVKATSQDALGAVKEGAKTVKEKTVQAAATVKEKTQDLLKKDNETSTQRSPSTATVERTGPGPKEKAEQATEKAQAKAKNAKEEAKEQTSGLSSK